MLAVDNAGATYAHIRLLLCAAALFEHGKHKLAYDVAHEVAAVFRAGDGHILHEGLALSVQNYALYGHASDVYANIILCHYILHAAKNTAAQAPLK